MEFSNLMVSNLSMKKRYLPEKPHEHGRFYCWGLGNDQSPLHFTDKYFQSNAWPQCR